ncbi:MAG: hypothetical protein ABUS51_07685, partial [Acidobacteriota bacterium]
MRNRFCRPRAAALAILLATSSLFAADGDTTPSQAETIARLQAALMAQQKQLEALQHSMEQQQKLLEKALGTENAGTLRPNLGAVAGIAPIVPIPAKVMPAVPLAQASPAARAAGAGNPCEAPPDSNAVPAYLRLGSVCVIPVGFMDLTSVWRDKNAGSSLGSNFGSVPFNNGVPGNLSEFRFTPQNSRLGFRAEGEWKGAHFIGYNEFDFLGTSGSNGIGVTNGAFVPRLRLFWIDVRKG